MSEIRNKGKFQFSANLEVLSAAALDPRIVVSNVSELYLKETWPYNGDTPYLYTGLVVAVTEDKALYMLIDKTKYTSAEGWKRLDAGSSISDISDLQSQLTDVTTDVETLQALIDTINGDDTTEGSVAKQIADAKSELSDTISNINTELTQKVADVSTALDELTDTVNDTIDTKLSAVYQYKGSKATFDELPTGDDVKVGDVYNVEAEHEGIAAGTNYAWNGTEWDALAGSVDLSDYAKTSEVESKIADAKTALETKIADVSTALDTTNNELSSLKDDVKDNSDKLVILTGDDTTEGSVAHTVKDAVDTLETSVNDKLAVIDTSVGKLETSVQEIKASVDTLLDTDETNEDSIAGKLKVLNDAIESLDTSVNESLKKHFDDEYTPLKNTVDAHTTSITEHSTKLTELEQLLEWVEYTTTTD